MSHTNVTNDDAKLEEFIRKNNDAFIDSVQSTDNIEESQDKRDIDFKLQCKRISKILDRSIEKTALAFCLPAIVESEQELIEKRCNKQDALQLMSTFNRHSANMENVSFTIDIRNAFFKT